MNNVGNSFSLPFKSPNWFATFAVMGLVSLIPIVGTMAMDGWMLTLLDNYREGRTDLPPAGLQYIGRGINLFVVQLVYGLVLAVVLIGPFVFFVFVAAGAGAASSRAAADSATTNAAFAPVFAFFPLWIGAISLFNIVRYVFLPPLVLATERGGVMGGLNPAHLWSIASKNWGHTLVAGVMVFAATFIAGLGIYACCVGIVVSLPYGYAVMAGVYRFYEASFEPAHQGPPAAAVA